MSIGGRRSWESCRSCRPIRVNAVVAVGFAGRVMTALIRRGVSRGVNSTDPGDPTLSVTRCPVHTDMIERFNELRPTTCACCCLGRYYGGTSLLNPTRSSNSIRIERFELARGQLRQVVLIKRPWEFLRRARHKIWRDSWLSMVLDTRGRWGRRTRADLAVGRGATGWVDGCGNSPHRVRVAAQARGGSLRRCSYPSGT